MQSINQSVHVLHLQWEGGLFVCLFVVFLNILFRQFTFHVMGICKLNQKSVHKQQSVQI